jgi:hypothetical protein
MNDTNINLGSMYVLCEFNASVWTARKLDRKKTDDVVTGSGATSKGAARVNKNLLAGRPELEEITRLVTEARNYVYDNTAPWSDAGQRLLVAARLPKFDARMEEYKGRFDSTVTAFVDVYPTLITAQALALGDMFNRAEYPTATDIAHKFAMECAYLPVPTAGDLRIDLVNDIQDDLRARLKKMETARVDKAVADINEKFIGHLKRMADRLTTDTDPKTGEPVGRRFTETLVSSAFELCDMVGDYNINGDPELLSARRRLEDALSGVTVVKLRDDPVKREEVRYTVSSILNQFQI